MVVDSWDPLLLGRDVDLSMAVHGIVFFVVVVEIIAFPAALDVVVHVAFVDAPEL